MSAEPCPQQEQQWQQEDEHSVAFIECMAQLKTKTYTEKVHKVNQDNMVCSLPASKPKTAVHIDSSWRQPCSQPGHARDDGDDDNMMKQH